MWWRKRNALVGWLLILLGRRMTERIVRRRLRTFFAALDPTPRARSRRRLPLVGAALAAAAAVALVVTRQRQSAPPP
jgi:hypothetical protein